MSAPAFSSDFAREVQEGLARPGQKVLPCRYFYDDVGSALFQAISTLPEYGLTRADDRVVRACAPEVAGALDGAVVAELGSGSGAKTRWLLEAFANGKRRPAYFPIDVSASALYACARELQNLACVNPIQGSYLEGLSRVSQTRPRSQPLLLLFLGSTIGNFSADEAAEFLLHVRSYLEPGDALLLGTDLEQEEDRMLLAYDDPVGVTAAFNLNLLARVNRELEGNFSLREFIHQVRYDRQQRRIEMHLRARRGQRVRIRQAGVDAVIHADETIWTESSHKFRLEDVGRLAHTSGFNIASQWVDAEWPFAETLLSPRP